MNLTNLDVTGLNAYMATLGESRYRSTQLIKWIHQFGVVDFDDMTNLSKAFRERLATDTEIRFPEIVTVQESADGTIKWLLKVDSGNSIETVFIPENDRGTLCVSSQVGCPLDCQFCATATQGFNRNLSIGEIIGQVWLTLSTAGHVPGIYRLRDTCPVSLAVSLHAPRDDIRDVIVPINRRFPIANLMEACRDYVSANPHEQITFEYVMLKGINDDRALARDLVRLLEGIPAKVNLIPFNPFPGARYTCSERSVIDTFREQLVRAGIVTITRKTRGDDIDAACGQLVGKVQAKSAKRRAELNSESVS